MFISNAILSVFHIWWNLIMASVFLRYHTFLKIPEDSAKLSKILYCFLQEVTRKIVSEIPTQRNVIVFLSKRNRERTCLLPNWQTCWGFCTNPDLSLRKLTILSNDNTLFLLESDDFLAACDRFQFQNRLDDFYFQNVGSKEDLNELCNVTKIVLVISHGNARVQNGFSVNKSCLCANT